MQLSGRMRAVAALITPGRVLADIGTDHGYIPIEMVESGRVERAIAMDVREGPLSRARENIRARGLEEKIQTRLSDGAAALRAGEADRAVIAGMGGRLTVRILAAGAEVFDAMEALILQPQSDLSEVRGYLQQNGWRIEAEDMVFEDGKYYPMMRAGRGRMGELTPEEALYGPLLLRDRNPVLAEFLKKEEKTYEAIRRALFGEPGEGAGRRMRQVEERLKQIRRAREELE